MKKKDNQIKIKELKCKHYKGEGYYYDIGDDQLLSLCDQCNLNLAGKLCEQMAYQLFAGVMLDKEISKYYEGMEWEERREIEKMETKKKKIR